MTTKDQDKEHYHDNQDDVDHDVKRQKIDSNLEDVEDTNIDSALLDAGDDEHARHEELMNRVKSGILQAVSEQNNRTDRQVNNTDDNLKENVHNEEDHDVMLHKVVDDNSYGDDDTLKRVAESTASMAVRAVNNSDKNSDDQQQHDDDEDERTQDYNDLINRHGMGSQEENVQVELDELNDRRLLAKRGRKTTAIAGSEAWKQQRKNSHKEVERRRRENINMAINSLSALLPVKETSKAAILSRAAEYIQKLKETENANIEKWTLQKLLSEQNASQLTTANEKLQEGLANAYKEVHFLKNLLKKNNIDYESDDEDTQN